MPLPNSLFCFLLVQPPFIGGNRQKIQQKIVKDKIKLPAFLSSDAHSLLKGVNLHNILKACIPSQLYIALTFSMVMDTAHWLPFRKGYSVDSPDHHLKHNLFINILHICAHKLFCIKHVPSAWRIDSSAKAKETVT